MDLNAVSHRWWSGLLGRQTAVHSVVARRALAVTALCLECSSICLLGCRSTDPQTSVEPIVVDHEKAEVQPPAEASARAEDKPPPADLGVDYDGPVSPEGYKLVKEADRREPPQGTASIPDLPPEEKERVEQTLATMKEFIRQLEIIHGADYCRAVRETAPSDAWGSKLTAFCKGKFSRIVFRSAGPDRRKGSEDDIGWVISIWDREKNGDVRIHD